MEKNLLSKTLLLSFFIHIIGISIFSIIFPLPSKKYKPVEVTFYPPSYRKDEISKKIVVKKIEEKKGNIQIKEETKVDITRVLKETILGSEEKIKRNFILDIPSEDIKIAFEKISSIPSLKIEKITDEEELIEGPAGRRKIIYKEKIDYPLWAQKIGIEGKVKIKFWINPEGKIIETEILQSSGYPELDLYSIEKFKNWLFETAETKENTWGMITFFFKLL